MLPTFAGFPPETLDFFRSLKRNNRREWFQPRKPLFDQHVRAPMLELIGVLNAAMMRFAPQYVTEPEDAIYRIYRDTRFSPDKTPYKTHIAATFKRRGLCRNLSACLYFSVSHENVEVAGGSYMPGKDELAGTRRHILEHHEEFRRILRARKLRELMGELQGNRLARAPKGFPPEHPAADLVRGKQWYFYLLLEPQLATTPQLAPELLVRFRALLPLLEFLNAPLVVARKWGAGFSPRGASAPLLP